MNRKELKKVIYDFNSISNRLMRVNFQEYNIILEKFLSYIDGEEIICDYIKDCGAPSYDIRSEVEEVSKSYGDVIFTLGDTTQKEVTNIYHILKYICENDMIIAVARSYSNSEKYQDMVKEFNQRVAMVLIRHIEGYLTKIGIDMGMDENIKYSITVNNGQVNLASDSATINANQYNGIDFLKLKELIDAVKKKVPCNISQDEVQSMNESIEVIENELAQPTPRKSFVKTALTGLQTIKGSAEFGAAVAALVQFVKSIY